MAIEDGGERGGKKRVKICPAKHFPDALRLGYADTDDILHDRCHQECRGLMEWSPLILLSTPIDATTYRLWFVSDGNRPDSKE